MTNPEQHLKIPNAAGALILPHVDQLLTDKALLRRIAHNTDIIRRTVVASAITVVIAFIIILFFVALKP